MAKDNVQMCSRVLRGFVELQPKPNEVGGRWVLQGYDVDFVDGLFVPVQHLGLYRRIVERYGSLVSGPIDSLPVVELMPQLLLVTVTQTLDMIAEIESVRDTELSRERVDAWLVKVNLANMIGFSVGWLSSLVEELDRTLRRSQSEALEEVTSKLQSVLTGFL